MDNLLNLTIPQSNKIKKVEDIYHIKNDRWDIYDRYLEGLIFSCFGKNFDEMTRDERGIAINIVLFRFHNIYGIDCIKNIRRLLNKLEILGKTYLIDVFARNGFLLGLLHLVDKECKFTFVGYDPKIIEPKYFEFIYQLDFARSPVYAFKKDTAIILSFPDIGGKNNSYEIIKNAEENDIDCIILFGYKKRSHIKNDNDWVIHPYSYEYLKKKWKKVLGTHFLLGIKRFIEVYMRN